MNATRKLAETLLKQTQKPQGIASFPARMGDSSGTISTGVAGYVNVRLYNGEVMEVFNNRVPVQSGWVMVGVDPTMPGLLQVLGPRDVFPEMPSASNIGAHHETHELFGGGDVTWIHSQQIMALLAKPSETSGEEFTVQVYGGNVATPSGFVEVLYQKVDISASQPAAGALMVLLQVDDTGVVSSKDGTAVDSREQLALSDVPLPDADHYPIWAVEVYDGQDNLRCDAEINDFHDLRFGGFAISGGAGFDLAAAIHAASASAISDDDEIGFWENVADALRKITWANIKTTLQTFFETLFPRKYAGKTIAPTVNDDSGDGYAVGDRWLDETNDKEYVALDVTVGAAVWVEVGGGGGIEVIDTRAVVMATTIDAGGMGLTTDTNELCVSLGGGSWMVSPFQLLAADPDPDIGLYEWNNRLGYGEDYITNKLLANVHFGANASTTEGGPWIDKSTDLYVFKIYLNGEERTVMVDFSVALGYLVHYPFDADQAVRVWTGNSVEVGLNGIPVIQEYETDMGAYPAMRILNGGTY